MATVGVKIKRLIKSTTEPPKSLLCPSCSHILDKPVISTNCGHTFCTSCAESLQQERAACPVDSASFEATHLVPNRALCTQIDEIEIYCSNGVQLLASTSDGEVIEVNPQGCQATMRYSQLEGHLRACQFVAAECPHGGSKCGQLWQKDLEGHLAVCSLYTCANLPYGCTFIGSREDKVRHEANCSFKESAQKMALDSLTTEVESLRKGKEAMDQRLSDLSAANQSAMAKLEEQSVMLLSLVGRCEGLEAEVKQLRSAMDSSSSSYTPMRRKKDPSRSSRVNGGGSLRMSSSSAVATASTADTGDYFNHWSMPFTLKCIGTFRGHTQTVWAVATKADTLYSSCSGGEIKMWSITDTSRVCVKTVKLHSTYVMCLAVSNKYLFSADYGGSVRSWVLGSLAPVGSIQAHQDIVSAMAAAGDLLFTACYGVVKVWEMNGLTEVHSFTGMAHWVRALAYDEHREIMYAGCHQKVYIWKISDNFEQMTTELATEHGTIYSLAVSKKYLIIGTQNQNIHIHDIATHQYLQSLNGHISTVTCLLVSPCERVLFSGSKDSSIQVWSLENLLPIQSLQRHEKCVYSLAVSKDILFSGSEDTEIKLYKVFKM